MMELGLGMLLLAGLVAVAAVTGAGVLRPLDRAARNSRLPLQFSLGDFFCLFLEAQDGSIYDFRIDE